MLLEKFSNEEQIEKKTISPVWKDILFIAVIWVIMNIVAAVYMAMSKNIYFWDIATYWDRARQVASGVLGEDIWAGVYNSIEESDYNYIAALPSAVWTMLFGESRDAYVLGLVNMYLMPAITMICIIAAKLSKGKRMATVLVILTLPALLFLTLIGFADMGGMLPCLLCMYLYFTRNEKKWEIWRYVLIGLLTVFIMLWRRWYAFFVVSFITAMAADALIFRNRKSPVIITAMTAGVILLLFFRGFVFNRLLMDYGSMYSGYKFAFSTDIKIIARYFGMVLLIALVAGSVAAGVIKREKRVVFLWIQLLLCFIMFVSVQTHGQQHLLLYIPSLVMLILILIKHIDRMWLFGLSVVIAVAASVNVYVVREQPENIQEIDHYALFPDFSMRPVIKENVDDIVSLKFMLDAAVPEGKTLGVISSSFDFNEDMLINAEPSLGIERGRTDYIITMPQVDSRDTDVSALYNADYMLVAFPAQIHLAPQNQKVVTEAVNSFIAYADFATAYEEMKGYKKEIGDIELRLYKRVREVTMQERITFEKRLVENVF